MVVFLLTTPQNDESYSGGLLVWVLRISVLLYTTAWPLGAVLVKDFSSDTSERRNHAIIVMTGWIINCPVYYFSLRTIQRALAMWKDPQEVRTRIASVALETVPATLLTTIFVVSSVLSSIGGRSNLYFLELIEVNNTDARDAMEAIEDSAAKRDYKAIFSKLNTGSMVPTIAIMAIFLKHVALIGAKDVLEKRLLPSEILVLTLQSFITIALILAISINLDSYILTDAFYFVGILLTWSGYLSCFWVCHQVLTGKHKHVQKRLAEELKSEKEASKIMKKVNELSVKQEQLEIKSSYRRGGYATD